MKKIEALKVKIFSDDVDKKDMLDMNSKNFIKGFTLDFEISLEHDKYKFRYGLIHQDYL